MWHDDTSGNGSCSDNTPECRDAVAWPGHDSARIYSVLACGGGGGMCCPWGRIAFLYNYHVRSGLLD